METSSLSTDERTFLLKLARLAVTAAAGRLPLPEVDPEQVTKALRAPGASFVTLTENGELRGCVGALEAYQPLAEDVVEHAAGAAREDYRFQPVRPDEVARLAIEISVLTAPQPLIYDRPEILLAHLRPGIDGVTLRDGFRRATFLPQVWEKLPDSEIFLSHLCDKMGAPPYLWRRKILQVSTYQVEEFREE